MVVGVTEVVLQRQVMEATEVVQLVVPWAVHNPHPPTRGMDMGKCAIFDQTVVILVVLL